MRFSLGLSAAFLAMAVPLAGCAKKEQPVAHEKREGLVPMDAVDRTAVVKGNNEFALDLYARLSGQEGNLFFSPFSISTALAMVYAGARGETASQMAGVMHYPPAGLSLHSAFGELIDALHSGAEGESYELVVANALWGQQGFGFLKEYLDLTERCYGAALREVDFAGATEATRATINEWVEKETRGKIEDLLAPGVLSALTRLVLTNAIYFKGRWASRFDEAKTEDSPFALLSGEAVSVPMMRQTGDFNYAEEEGLQVLELPYVGDDMSMIVLLPRAADGLAELENRLSFDNLTQMLAGLSRRKVEVRLPRFTFTSSFRLAGVLRAMGMTDAFSLPPADFSGMDGKEDLFISAVIHKAFVDVNEEGTEAAAATAVVMELAAMPEPPPVFRADHPFIFLVRDAGTGSILFMGRVTNPEE